MSGGARRILVLAGLLSVPWIACAADPALPPARQREVLRDALNAFDEAGNVARTDPTRATELYRQAAAGFLALRDAGLRNASLEYNLGNAYFRLGDLGRAVLHYRRAERIGSADARCAANLRYARGQVEPLIAPSGERRLARQLLFWHYGSTIGQRYQALLLCAGAGWLALVAWLRWRHRPLVLAGLVLVAAGLVDASSLLWQTYAEAQRPHAVVVAGPTPLRLGRNDSADLALRQPLGPGTEVRVLQQRGDWVEVRLSNDQPGWLPASAVEPV